MSIADPLPAVFDVAVMPVVLLLMVMPVVLFVVLSVFDPLPSNETVPPPVGFAPMML